MERRAATAASGAWADGTLLVFVDEADSNNAVSHLDDPASGASTVFAVTSGETDDLGFGG